MAMNVPNPPWPAPPWVSNFGWCGPADWRTTEESWWWWGWPLRARQQWAANPWAWCGAGLRPGPPDPWWGRVSLGAVQCQAGCPAGAVAGPWGRCRLPGCPWMCRGCQAGWPFDANLRHIGPVPLPAANRWDCNRVKWLGAGGASVS